LRTWLAIFSVVNKCADGNFRRKLWRAADVVVVIVRNQHVVNFLDTCIVRRGHDSVRIAPVVTRPPGIDQQGIALRCDEQRSLPAFYIYKVDAK